MNTSQRLATLAAVTLLGLHVSLSAAADVSPQVGTPCKALPNIERRIVEKSLEGPESLRSFVWMTHIVYGIDMPEVADSLGEWQSRARCSKAGSGARDPH